MKVYVVTHGQYSDFTIDAIFSTPELAKKYANNSARSDPFCTDSEITEWTVDELKDAIVHTMFVVQIELETGNLMRQHSYPSFGIPRTEKHISEPGHWCQIGNVRVAAPVSFEHSLKLAAEMRQQYNAEHKLNKE